MIVDMQGTRISLSSASSADCSPFRCLLYVRQAAGCIQLIPSSSCIVDVGCVSLFTESNKECGLYLSSPSYYVLNAGLYGILSVRYLNELKMPMPGAVRYQNKGAQSGTGMPDAQECRCRRHWTRCRCPALVWPNFLPVRCAYPSFMLINT